MSTTSTYLAQYGISEASLSPDVKDGITEVLRAATKEGLQQLGQILQKEAQKRGINTGGSSTTDTSAADEAVRIAQEEYDRLEAEKKAKKQRQILIGVIGVVLVIGLVVAVLATRKKKPGA